MVSVIMPVFNSEKYLKKTIQSVLNQVYKDFELIIINDCSTDNSEAIIKSFNDSRILYIKNEKNAGISHARNKAINASKGDYIAIWDHDDLSSKNRFKKQVEFLDKNLEYGMVSSWYKFIDGKDNVMYNVKPPVSSEEIKTAMLFNSPFGPAWMYRKSVLDEIGLFLNDFFTAEDAEINIRLIKKYKICNIPEYLLYYRIHGENTSITKRNLQCDAGRKMILEHLMPHFKFNFNDYEFEMHNKVSQWEEKYFNQPDKLKELNDWFLKLLKYNDGFYGENELYKTLSYWWVYVCVKSKQYKYIFGGYDFKLNRKIFKKIVFEYIFLRIIQKSILRIIKIKN